MQFERRILVIFGPTGVGKSDLACTIAKKIPAEIVNADMGQLYTPCSIGTAKPDWRSEFIRHHLFDVIHQPRNCTVVEYRNMLIPVLSDIWSRGKMPIIVGGSGFYVQSILYPPTAGHTTTTYAGDWHTLNAIDQHRAAQIHPHDTYRITRALNIWYSSGIKPSEYTRRLSPLCNTHIVWVGRDRTELHKRINKRVMLMIQHGWIEECKALVSTEWESFMHGKKLIGYTDLFEYLHGKISLDEAVNRISQKTRVYAKRQETFWRMLKLNLATDACCKQAVTLEELNLTLSDPYLYINQLSERLTCDIQ